MPDWQVSDWLASIGMSRYSDAFIDEGWDDLTSVKSMVLEDVMTVPGMKRGHAKSKLMPAIQALAQAPPSAHRVPARPATLVAGAQVVATAGSKQGMEGKLVRYDRPTKKWRVLWKRTGQESGYKAINIALRPVPGQNKKSKSPPKQKKSSADSPTLLEQGATIVAIAGSKQGQTGRLVSFDRSLKKWRVRWAASGKESSYKPSNLSLVPSASSSSSSSSSSPASPRGRTKKGIRRASLESRQRKMREILEKENLERERKEKEQRELEWKERERRDIERRDKAHREEQRRREKEMKLQSEPGRPQKRRSMELLPGVNVVATAGSKQGLEGALIRYDRKAKRWRVLWDATQKESNYKASNLAPVPTRDTSKVAHEKAQARARQSFKHFHIQSPRSRPQARPSWGNEDDQGTDSKTGVKRPPPRPQAPPSWDDEDEENALEGKPRQRPPPQVKKSRARVPARPTKTAPPRRPRSMTPDEWSTSDRQRPSRPTHLSKPQIAPRKQKPAIAPRRSERGDSGLVPSLVISPRRTQPMFAPRLSAKPTRGTSGHGRESAGAADEMRIKRIMAKKTMTPDDARLVREFMQAQAQAHQGGKSKSVGAAPVGHLHRKEKFERRSDGGRAKPAIAPRRGGSSSISKPGIAPRQRARSKPAIAPRGTYVRGVRPPAVSEDSTRARSFEERVSRKKAPPRPPAKSGLRGSSRDSAQEMPWSGKKAPPRPPVKSGLRGSSRDSAQDMPWSGKRAPPMRPPPQTLRRHSPVSSAYDNDVEDDISPPRPTSRAPPPWKVPPSARNHVDDDDAVSPRRPGSRSPPLRNLPPSPPQYADDDDDDDTDDDDDDDTDDDTDDGDETEEDNFVASPKAYSTRRPSKNRSVVPPRRPPPSRGPPLKQKKKLRVPPRRSGASTIARHHPPANDMEEEDDTDDDESRQPAPRRVHAPSRRKTKAPARAAAAKPKAIGNLFAEINARRHMKPTEGMNKVKAKPKSEKKKRKATPSLMDQIKAGRNLKSVKRRGAPKKKKVTEKKNHMQIAMATLRAKIATDDGDDDDSGASSGWSSDSDEEE